jgi:hypothetical protein
MHLSQLGKLAVVAMAGLAIAHPGAHEPSSYTDLSKRTFLRNARRSLDHCADHLERREFMSVLKLGVLPCSTSTKSDPLRFVTRTKW